MFKIVLFLVLLVSSIYAKTNHLKVGVLAYGTVNWELNAMKIFKIDKINGFTLDIKPFANKNAISIALMAGEVDVIVTDWIWVNRQHYRGNSHYFYPYSKAVGGIYTSDTSLKTLNDLKGKKIGIAGGPLDKSWLLFQAYCQKQYGFSLKEKVDAVYASPVILNQKILEKKLDAVVNFWHYNARLKAKGYKEFLSLRKSLSTLGIKDTNIPFIGWVFKADFADTNSKLINAFLQASYMTKIKLSTDTEAWNTIRPMMHASSDVIFNALKTGYIEGIPSQFDKDTIAQINSVYKLLKMHGGTKLIGNAKTLDDTIFWAFKPKMR